MVTRERGGQLRRLMEVDRLVGEQSTAERIKLEIGCCERTVRRAIAVLERECGVRVVWMADGRLRYADGRRVFMPHVVPRGQ